MILTLIVSVLVVILLVVVLLTIKEAYIYKERLKLLKDIKEYDERVLNGDMSVQEIMFDLEELNDRMKDINNKEKSLFPYLKGS